MSRALVAPAVAAVPTVRAVASPNVVASGFAFFLVASLAASDGGYWPVAWSWTALALSWVAILGVLFRDEIRIAFAERLFGLFSLALLAWILISLLWTTSPGRTIFEAERTLAYVAAILASLVLVRARAYKALLGGTWAGISLVSTYALATRLFPERLGVFDPIAGYRLSEPLGYWNALAIFAGMGSLLALGFAARAPSRLVRALGGASLLVLLPTMYFTFSRGAWIAVGLALASAIALDLRRLQLVTAALALAPAPAVGLAFAHDSDGLTNATASLAAASREGHRLALVLVALAVVNGLVAVGLQGAQRLSFGRTARTAYAAGLVVALAVALTAIFVRYGSPPTLAQRAYDTLAKPASSRDQNLNQRLFTLSSRARVLTWKAAWADFEDNRLLGSGAGTYELYWAEHRPSPIKVRDAHSLYLETLAELGPVGLILLAGGLLIPVAAAIRARMRSFVSVALAAYVAFLVHAGVDWDWEMSGLTITGLLCGVALLVAARTSVEPLSLRARVAIIIFALVVAAAAFVGIMGNQQLQAARNAVNSGQWAKAEDHARKAMPWMPWSSEPWQRAGQAQIALRQRELARSTLRTAIAKDPHDWELWLDLSLASNGRNRREAAAEAVRLNPLGPELRSLRRLLGMNGGGG